MLLVVGSSVHVRTPDTRPGDGEGGGPKVKLRSFLCFSSCQLASVIASLVVLFTTLPMLQLCFFSSLCTCRSLPSCLLKAKGCLGELEFISLPNIGSPLSLKLVVSKRTDNSSMFLFIFPPSSASCWNRCLGVCWGGSSQSSGIRRCVELGIDETQSKQMVALSLLTRLSA